MKTGIVGLRSVTFGAAGLLFSLAVHAFSPPVATEGPLTVRMTDPGEVQALETPVVVPITLTNASNQSLTGKLRIAVCDDWRVEDKRPRAFTLPPHGAQAMPVTVVAGKQTYAALYPVHAFADFRVAGNPAATAHAILILKVTPEALAKINATTAIWPCLQAPRHGALRLDDARNFQLTIATHDRKPIVKPVGWHGADHDTGGTFDFHDADRGEVCHAINVHPPYRNSWGQLWADCRIALPRQQPITRDFATALRDSDPRHEPPSDGVEYQIQVDQGDGFKLLFRRFSLAKRWEPAQVDLSAFAGREVTLRFVTDPGPAHDTTCDSAFWAQPTIQVGTPNVVEPASDRQTRLLRAIANARAVLAGMDADWAWKLESGAGQHGTAVVPGPHGIADAFIAFSDGQRDLIFEGFTVEVDKIPFGPQRHGLPCEHVRQSFRHGRGVLEHAVLKGDDSLCIRTELWAEHGGLRVAFSMPGATRDSRGEPRFTTLALGPASAKAQRVYAGFGNVLENPGRFDLAANGFQLSTRHVGMDFTNGLSLVQASDVFPDLFRVVPEQNLYALYTHHDATISLLPSAHGAFAAVRAYRAIADFRPAGGVPNLQGRICLDQWGGDYRAAANGLERVALYGVTNAVFVKHVWQRWGYDYRLPDIYPPAGNMDDYLAMADACKRHGILFAPHDNYIDFYPDAAGYSYDHILFNADGTPQQAWFNKGRQAQSYRWLPTAFDPWLERNLKLVKRSFAPTAYFVDVFSAIAPIDFYDRSGRFYTKLECAKRWGAAFDQIRATLGHQAPTISEAGHDALIGHLDAGESDHAGWMPAGKSYFSWHLPADDGERVPWHDMASHGAFVLLAGGLGHRYAGMENGVLDFHSYASDDYLSLTVLGGRNPMCEGPFSRGAVMTYWLLHDVCAELAKREILEHRFADDDIHRQRVTFSGDAGVVVNRGTNDWTINGVNLPRYGFQAQAGGAEAGITRRAGLITAMAWNGHTLFVDARPEVTAQRPYVNVHVNRFDDLGNGHGRLHLEWEVLQPVPAGYKVFIHFADPQHVSSESIVAQGYTHVEADRLARPGKFSSLCDVTLPVLKKAQTNLAVRVGLYHPGQGGTRLHLGGIHDGGDRIHCGIINITHKGTVTALSWQPEAAEAEAAEIQSRLNTTGKVIDFGRVATAGAFRRDCTAAHTWVLTPLPDSAPFPVILKLDQLGATTAKVTRIATLNEARGDERAVDFAQVGTNVRFSTDAQAFAYRIYINTTP